MPGKIARRYADVIASKSKLVILICLLLTAAMAVGAVIGETEDAGIGDFEVDSPETEAATFIEENYGTDDTVIAQLVVRDEGGDVLTRESLLDGLRLQQEVRDDASLDETLTDQGFVGVENVVGTTAVFADAQEENEPLPTGIPTLEAQIDALEDRSGEEFEELLTGVLDPNTSLPGDEDPQEFLPRGYEPGETKADARLTFIFQVDESGDNEEPQAAYDAQVAIADLADERFEDSFVFGQGISNAASSSAVGDSFAIITPFALVLVLFVLGIAYRDVLDILLAVFGIGVVMVWLAGIMGWLAIPMNQILIAVPFLLIGLSIDYALHVVMRYREARNGRLDTRPDRPPDGGESDEAVISSDTSIRTAMALGLGNVILALGAATFSTGVGFASNVVSPLGAIQDFAILSAGGILATFIVFAVLVPALKVELDSFFEGRLGRSREKPAFGVGSGFANRALGRIAALASSVPLVVIVVALLLATGGAYGATTIDTEFNEADFLPENPPAWTEYLPGPLEPGTYTISDDLRYLSESFQLRGEGGQSQILIRGDVTDGDVLTSIDNADQQSEAGSAIQLRPDGTAATTGPHTVIRDVASDNATVQTALDERDTTGDGLPDEDLDRFYSILFDADEEAASEVLSRTDDGKITSARLLISVQSDRSAQTIADDTRAFATIIEEGAPGSTAVATGQVVTTAVIQDALLETLVQAFSVTLVVILVFLTILFWVRYRSPVQGALLLVPVVAALCWLLGAMALLDIPFNSETAVITSLAIGLGVDYSIHAGERFVTERERHDSLEDALETTITGTGGALLASAATTAAAFGVLALALAPPLQRFGIVTGTAIILAFVACVTVLPCLLVVRERFSK